MGIVRGQLTVAWNSGECHIENDLKFLASAAVNKDSCVHMHSSEVKEFNKGESDNEECRSECHWATGLAMRWPAPDDRDSHKAPVLVFTLTSSLV